MVSKLRDVIVAGNWKMNHNLAETENFFSALQTELASAQVQASERVMVCLFPPYLSLGRALDRVKALSERLPISIQIGAQNAHWEKQGAYTGEVSGAMLKELGLNWVLVGHSERRQFFGETDETVRKRGESLLQQGLRVILCVGESRAEREQGRTFEIIKRQLLGAMPEREQGIAAFLDGRLVIAYEPVWAIGTGLTATPTQAEEAHSAIRKLLVEHFGATQSEKTQILYGGSVTPENVTSILAERNIDGVLVGGASLKPAGLVRLIQAAHQI